MKIFRILLTFLIVACGYFTTYTLYAMVTISPYVHVDMVGCLVFGLGLAYMAGLLFMDIDFEQSLAEKFNNTTVLMLIGTLIFFICLLFLKDEYETDIANASFGRIIDKVGLNRDIDKNLYLNDEQKKLFEYYKNKDFSKLTEYTGDLSSLEKINDEKLAQLIVNVKTVNDKEVTKLFSKYIEDQIISTKEYNEINELIIKQTINENMKQK